MECLPEGGWFTRGRSPRENHPPEGTHSIRIPTLAWHICFIIPNKPQFGKISMKTTMTAGRSSVNGGRFAGGHFAGGHDGMANLCKPITAYDFHVRYNNVNCHVSSLITQNLSKRRKSLEPLFNYCPFTMPAYLYICMLR